MTIGHRLRPEYRARYSDHDQHDRQRTADNTSAPAVATEDPA
jgi:hypothetical protein